MLMSNLITYVQNRLDDAGVNWTGGNTTGVSFALNEGQRLASILTLCYEKASTMPSAACDAYEHLMLMPTDCIVPIFVVDNNTKTRVYPVSLGDLEMEDQTWWSTTGSAIKYYCLFNPAGDAKKLGQMLEGKGYSMLVYPRVSDTTNPLYMYYAAIPADVTNTATNMHIPVGHEKVLTDYALFLGFIRQSSLIDRAINHLKSFFNSIRSLNEFVKSQYPEGRDFEPRAVEDILERTDTDYTRQQKQRQQWQRTKQ